MTARYNSSFGESDRSLTLLADLVERLFFSLRSGFESDSCGDFEGSITCGGDGVCTSCSLG